MKLYLLRPKENLSKDNPWETWYDKCFGEVVRAKDESEARKISDSIFGNPKTSDCIELTNKGKSESIITDVHRA